MQIVEMPVGELVPYENNPRKNDGAVEAVANSIKEFGFKVPIVVDRRNVIIAGHTRLRAAKLLGLETVPVIRAEDLTEEQVNAFRLADNRTQELAEWDFEMLNEEMRKLSEIDMTQFGFERMQSSMDEWQAGRKKFGEVGEEDEDYQAFVDKFAVKKTTDDCYTPPNVYEAVADWVAKEYNLDKGKFVRPFYPGGDYQKENYASDCVVVDNPPFSILAEILRWYAERDVKFFLFGPTLTLFTADHDKICTVCTGNTVTFENGAKVNIGFKTNLENGIAVRTAPELTEAIDKCEKENTKTEEKQMKYEYPDCVITSAKVSGWSKFGVDFRLPRESAVKIAELDAQAERGLDIFGGGGTYYQNSKL